MSKKEKASPLPTPRTWPTIAIIAGFGALLGATLTYFALRRPAPTPGTIALGTTNPDPTAHRPAPELTAGQTPAQADRTLGNFYYDHQNWPQAIERYQSAIRQGSDDADIRTDLGNAYRFAGRPDDALVQYTLAQKMSPTHEFSLFNQGGLLLEDLKQPGRAVEIWQEYLKRFPSGRNVEAARQLIARTQGGPTLPAAPGAAGSSPSPTAPPQGNATEALILRQIQAVQSKAGQP